MFIGAGAWDVRGLALPEGTIGMRARTSVGTSSIIRAGTDRFPLIQGGDVPVEVRSRARERRPPPLSIRSPTLTMARYRPILQSIVWPGMGHLEQGRRRVGYIFMAWTLVSLSALMIAPSYGIDRRILIAEFCLLVAIAATDAARFEFARGSEK